MEELQPIVVVHLFPEILDHLVTLLAELSAQEWARPTACPGWSVKDVAQHLLGDEIGILSRKRDGHRGSVESGADLVTLVNDLNARWVDATRRISPRLLGDLLRFAGTQAYGFFQTLDPHALGGPVSWAGPDPAPVWLDLAREYTERWLHQQHIRNAVGRPGLKEPRYLAPVLDTFVRALPQTYRDTAAVESTVVTLTISGDSGGQWSLRREDDRWELYLGVSEEPAALVLVDEEIAWRLFTRGLTPEAARSNVIVRGDQRLGLKVLDTVSIIA